MKGLKIILAMSFITCLFTLQAQVLVSPAPVLNYQHLYTDDESVDYSCLGIGAELGYETSVNQTDFVGISASYLRYGYKDYHDFHDFRGTMNTKILLIPYGKEDASVRLYKTFGIGADYIIRDDGEKNLNVLVNTGLQLSLAQSEKSDLFVKAELGLVIRDGLQALNTTIGLGYVYRFGGSKSASTAINAVEAATYPVTPAEQVAPVQAPAVPEEAPAVPEEATAVPEEAPVETPVVPEVIEASQAEASQDSSAVAPVHVHDVISGYSILESADGKIGYRCFICSTCGLVCEIIEP